MTNLSRNNNINGLINFCEVKTRIYLYIYYYTVIYLLALRLSAILICYALLNKRTIRPNRLSCRLDYYSSIFTQNITNVGFQQKPCLFFLFCDLDFIIFFNLVGGIRDYFGKKILKTKVVFIRAPFRPPLRPSGPAEAPSGFNLFLFRTS